MCSICINDKKQEVVIVVQGWKTVLISECSLRVFKWYNVHPSSREWCLLFVPMKNMTENNTAHSTISSLICEYSIVFSFEVGFEMGHA